MLRAGGVAAVVDVRRFPGSRRSPQFGRDAMASWLPAAGVAYSWAPDLGGRRAPRPDSAHVALTNASFRAYADHMGTPEFAAALDHLVAQPGPVAVLCAETLWWRCHRRLLADAVVLVRDVPVAHLRPGAPPVPYVPTAGVRVEDGRLVYDAGAPPLGLA